MRDQKSSACRYVVVLIRFVTSKRVAANSRESKNVNDLSRFCCAQSQTRGPTASSIKSHNSRAFMQNWFFSELNSPFLAASFIILHSPFVVLDVINNLVNLVKYFRPESHKLSSSSLLAKKLFHKQNCSAILLKLSNKLLPEKNYTSERRLEHNNYNY